MPNGIPEDLQLQWFRQQLSLLSEKDYKKLVLYAHAGLRNMRLLERQDTPSAEDIVHTAIRKLLSGNYRAYEWRQDASVIRAVQICIYGTIGNVINSIRRQPPMETIDGGAEDDSKTPSSIPTDDDPAGTTDVLNLLDRLRTQFSTQEMDILTRYIDGQVYQAIAAEKSLSVSTIHKILKRFKRFLEGENS